MHPFLVKDLVTVTHALVTQRLSYYNVLYVGLFEGVMEATAGAECCCMYAGGNK